MEAAQVPSQDGGQADAGQQEGQQEQQGQQIPPELLERLDEVKSFRDEMQPLLQQFGQQGEEGEEGYEDGEQPGLQDFIDPETGMALDPDGIEQYIAQQIEQGVQKQLGETNQGVDEIRQFLQDQELDALEEDYPELQDPKVAQALAQRASEFAQSRGNPQLATDPEFVEMVYLAGKALEQAQQGAPAGEQGVHLEGGSGQPGQPQVNETQERFKRMAQQGATGGVWGRSLDDL